MVACVHHRQLQRQGRRAVAPQVRPGEGLEGQHQVVDGGGVGDRLEAGHRLLAVAEGCAGFGLQQHGRAEVLQHPTMEPPEIAALVGDSIDQPQPLCHGPVRDMCRQVQRQLLAAHVQQLPQVLLSHRRAIGGSGLLQQVLGVSKAASGHTGDQGQGPGLGLDAFFPADVGELVGDGLQGDSAEVEALAPRYDGEGDLVRLRRGEDEDYVGRRLLQGLQEGVEGRLGQHVDLVDDVDLRRGLVGAEVDPVVEVSDVVYAAVAGGVDLDEVQRSSLIDGGADVAGVVRLAFLGREAVDCLGENAGGGGLAGASGSAEEVRVGHASQGDGLTQRLGDGLLAYDLVQPPGPPLAVEDFAHRSRTCATALSSSAFIAASSSGSRWS